MSKPRDGNAMSPSSHNTLPSKTQESSVQPPLIAGIPTSPGLPSRITSSARVLTRDVWNSDKRAGPSSMASLLASAASSSEKGNASVSGASQASVYASEALNEARDMRTLHDDIDLKDANGKGKMRNEVPVNDDAFNAFAYPTAEQLEVGASLKEAHDRSTTEDIARLSAKGDDIDKIEKEDGAAVVALLLDTKNEMWYDSATVDTDFNDGAEVSVEDLFSNDSDLIREVNMKLGQTSKHRAPSPGNPANFMPQVEMLHLPTSVLPPVDGGKIDPLNGEYTRGVPYTLRVSSPSEDSGVPSYFHSSHKQRVEWTQQWLSDWDTVLRHYTDEVWGPDQQEYIQQAKEALQDLKSPKDDSGWRLDDDKAVLRLKMVLGHLRLPATQAKNSMIGPNSKE